MKICCLLKTSFSFKKTKPESRKLHNYLSNVCLAQVTFSFLQQPKYVIRTASFIMPRDKFSILFVFANQKLYQNRTPKTVGNISSIMSLLLLQNDLNSDI